MEDAEHSKLGAEAKGVSACSGLSLVTTIVHQGYVSRIAAVEVRTNSHRFGPVFCDKRNHS